MVSEIESEFRSCLRFIEVLAEAARKFSATTQRLNGWKGVEHATHRVSICDEESGSTLSLAIEVKTESDAFWLWQVQVRCTAEGWSVSDHRQGLDEEGYDIAAAMPEYRGMTLESMLAHMERAVGNMLRNIDSGWWLRTQPTRQNERRRGIPRPPSE